MVGGAEGDTTKLTPHLCFLLLSLLSQKFPLEPQRGKRSEMKAASKRGMGEGIPYRIPLTFCP